MSPASKGSKKVCAASVERCQLAMNLLVVVVAMQFGSLAAAAAAAPKKPPKSALIDSKTEA